MNKQEIKKKKKINDITGLNNPHDAKDSFPSPFFYKHLCTGHDLPAACSSRLKILHPIISAVPAASLNLGDRLHAEEACVC